MVSYGLVILPFLVTICSFSSIFSKQRQNAHPALLPGLPLPPALLEAEVVVSLRIRGSVLLWPETKTFFDWTAFVVKFYLAWAEAAARRRAKASFWLCWEGEDSQWVFRPSFASASAAAGDLTGQWTVDSGQATWLFLCSWDLHANSVSQIPQFKHDSNGWDKIKSMVGGVQTSLSSWLLLSRFTDPSQTAEHEARPILRAESITAHCLCSHFFKSIAPSCKLASTLDICMCAMCIA